MKEDMYTYHYFQNRALKRPARACNVIFHASLVLAAAYMAAMLVFLFK